jgi:hypothetical protein
MKLLKQMEVCTALIFATASAMVYAAECPRSMPVNMLEDCIISENGGTPFPESDYAYIDEYNAWLETQKEPGASDKSINNDSTMNTLTAKRPTTEAR